MPHDLSITRREALSAGAAALTSLAISSKLAAQESKPLRAGMIGLDTSHVTAFAKILSNPKNEGDLAGIKLVAGFPGGTDIPASKDRVANFTKALRETYNVEIVDSIAALLPKVDVVFLESVDGRPHLEQVRPVLKAGKPVFIDKPVAGSLADAIQIYALARETKTPCFSSSSLRFGPGVQAIRNDPKVGEILGCDAYGPSPIEPTHPDLFWYGIHGCELLFTILGVGCESVVRTNTKDADMVVGTWKGGRIGSFRGIRAGKAEYGATVFGKAGVGQAGGSGGYEPLLREICKFFKTGKPPVSPEETLDIFAFMEAADESKRKGGTPVTIESVMAKAREAKKS